MRSIFMPRPVRYVSPYVYSGGHGYGEEADEEDRCGPYRGQQGSDAEKDSS